MEVRLYLLFAVLTFILLVVGFVVGGLGGIIVALIFAFLLNFISYWYSDKIILSVYKAKPVSENDYPEIYQSIKKVCSKAKIPNPKLYIIDQKAPNAFATGRSPKKSAVVITKGLLEGLDVDEIEGVLAHEISHIKHRDTLVQAVAAVIGAAISWFGYMLWFSSNEERNGLVLIFVLILAPIAAMLVRMAISRSREFFADKEGGELSNPLHLASALTKISNYGKQMKGNPSVSHMFIVNPFSGGFSKLFSTHPPVQERVTRLRKMAISP